MLLKPLLGLVIFLTACGALPVTGDVHTARRSESLDGVRSAAISLTVSEGVVTLLPLAGGGDLLTVDAAYLGTLDYLSNGDPARVITIENAFTGAGTPDAGSLPWSVGLRAGVPISLTHQLGVGSARLDLTGITLTQLNVRLGAGDLDLRLPPGGYTATISVSSGTLNVSLPDSAGVRVEAAPGGLAPPLLPARFVPVEPGIWETEGYATADEQLELHVSVGSGGMTIR